MTKLSPRSFTPISHLMSDNFSCTQLNLPWVMVLMSQQMNAPSGNSKCYSLWKEFAFLSPSGCKMQVMVLFSTVFGFASSTLAIVLIILDAVHVRPPTLPILASHPASKQNHNHHTLRENSTIRGPHHAVK